MGLANLGQSEDQRSSKISNLTIPKLGLEKFHLYSSDACIALNFSRRGLSLIVLEVIARVPERVRDCTKFLYWVGFHALEYCIGS